MKIVNRFTGAILYEDDHDTIQVTIKSALAQNVNFMGDNLTEADLTGADLTGADLTGTNLTRADFMGDNLTGANFTEADLTGANFTEADLTGANFTEADLTGANFRWTNLTGANLLGADLTEADLASADLRGAILPHGVPAIPQIHIAVRDAIAENGNALDMSDWHTCESTHCRAGWVIVLAGEAGTKLQSELGTNAAAALIYQASDPGLARIPNWMATNEAAMAEIDRMARRQQQEGE